MSAKWKLLLFDTSRTTIKKVESKYKMSVDSIIEDATKLQNKLKLLKAEQNDKTKVAKDQSQQLIQRLRNEIKILKDHKKSLEDQNKSLEHVKFEKIRLEEKVTNLEYRVNDLREKINFEVEEALKIEAEHAESTNKKFNENIKNLNKQILDSKKKLEEKNYENKRLKKSCSSNSDWKSL